MTLVSWFTHLCLCVFRCVVWTGDDRVFFFNPTIHLSVWERPGELIDRDISHIIEDPPHKRKKTLPSGLTLTSLSFTCVSTVSLHALTVDFISSWQKSALAVNQLVSIGMMKMKMMTLNTATRGTGESKRCRRWKFSMFLFILLVKVKMLLCWCHHQPVVSLVLYF